MKHDTTSESYKRNLKKLNNTSKIFIDPREEEEALNIYAEDGFVLKKASFWDLLNFDTSKRRQVYHRVDFCWFSSKEEFTDYVAERALKGWAHVWGTKKSGRQYFVCDVDEATLEPLGQDEDLLFPRERALEGRKRRFLAQVLLLIGILIVYALFIFSVLGFSLRSFWFVSDRLIVEFPIVILKTGPFLALLGFCIYYLICYFKVKKIQANEAH